MKVERGDCADTKLSGRRWHVSSERGGIERARAGSLLSLALLVLLTACSGGKGSVPEITLPETTVSAATTGTAGSEDGGPTTTAVPAAVKEVSVNPGDDLSALVQSATEGTTFILAEGTHRMHSIVPKDGMTFRGSAGAVMSGARVLEGFEPDGDYWRLSGIDPTGTIRGRCIDGYSGCELSQDLFMDDVMLWQVTAIDDLDVGRWLWEGDTIYVANDPTSRRVELSVTEHAFYGSADDVTITNLKIEKYATPAQEGTVQAQELGDAERGQRWLLADLEITGSHGVGLRTGDATVVRNVHVHHNGQMGIAVSGGTDVLLEDNEIAFNNIAGFDWTWEGGGMKATRTSGLIVRGNHTHDNIGPGLWTDIDAEDTLYEHNLVVDNEASGIFHEISFAATIRWNTVEGNGFGKAAWLWGAGILIAASADVDIYENKVANNADGIAGIQQVRDDSPRAPHFLENIAIYDNTIAMSEGQTGVVDDSGDDAVFTERNIVFASNTYVGVSGRRFAWDSRLLDRRGWLATGQDEGAVWLDS